ncbi:MAG: hypothetical protein PHQ75_11835 [Thermoguttaceae bacterium]|nr:hypothetical protein [Thermoguttaceae bacterium]
MFDFPALLWFGVLAILVPLLHLLRFGHEVRRDWSAMSLLEAAVRKASRRMVPLQWSVVILRTVLIGCLVLLVASPGRDGLFPSLFRKPRHHVIVFDDSASTGELVGQETLIAKQRRMVHRYLATNVAASDQITLWRLSRLADLKGRADCDRLPGSEISKEVLSVLDAFEPSDAAGSPGRILSDLDHYFGERDSSKQERLVWAGDFRALDWNDLPRDKAMWTRIENRGMEVVCLFSSDDKANRDGVKNLAVTSVKHLPGVPCVGYPQEFEVAVSNHGEQDVKDVPIAIRVDGVMVPGGRIASISSRSSAQTTILLSFSTPGVHRVEFSVEADVLACDNVYYKTACVVRQLSVLLVTMDDKEIATKDADKKHADQSRELAKTISAALNPGVDMGVAVSIQNDSTIDRRSPGRHDIVVLCGYHGGHRELPGILNDYVIGGGNLVVIPTMGSDYAAIHSELGTKGMGVLPLDPEEPVSTDTQEALRFDHWTMRVFTQCESLSDSFRITRFCPVKRSSVPVTEQSPYIVAVERGGRPLIIISSRGAGHVSEWLFSPLPQWSNFSSHLSYPVVWRDLVAWLCCSEEKTKCVGDPLVFSFSRLDRGAVCGVDYFRNETKESLGNIVFASRNNRFVAQMNNVVQAGFYSLSPDVNRANGTTGVTGATGTEANVISNEEPDLQEEACSCFAVNVNRRESSLDAASSECLRTLRLLGVKCRVEDSSGIHSESASQSVVEPFLILLVCILVLWELALSNLFYRSAHRRKA